VFGAAVFAGAHRLGLEDAASKKPDAPYRSGRSGDWLKVGNPNSAVAKRFERTSDEDP
jgi:ATP-dependent DNA ligase